MLTDIKDRRWLEKAGTIKTIIKPHNSKPVVLENNVYSLQQLESLISNIAENNLRIRPREIYLRGNIVIEDAFSVLNDKSSLTWYDFFGEQYIRFTNPQFVEIEYMTYYPVTKIPYLKKLAEVFQSQRYTPLTNEKPELVKLAFEQFCGNHQKFIQNARASKSLKNK